MLIRETDAAPARSRRSSPDQGKLLRSLHPQRWVFIVQRVSQWHHQMYHLKMGAVTINFDVRSKIVVFGSNISPPSSSNLISSGPSRFRNTRFNVFQNFPVLTIPHQIGAGTDTGIYLSANVYLYSCRKRSRNESIASRAHLLLEIVFVDEDARLVIYRRLKTLPELRLVFVHRRGDQLQLHFSQQVLETVRRKTHQLR